MINSKLINETMFYSFKELCDFAYIEPRDRTRYGRKAKRFSNKVDCEDKNGKDIQLTYVNIYGIYIILSELSLFNKLKCIFKLRSLVSSKELFKLTFSEKYRERLYTILSINNN